MVDLDSEARYFGAHLAEFAAYFLNLWGSSDPIIEAVLHHHDPAAEGTRVFDATVVVHVAHSLVCGHIGQRTLSAGTDAVSSLDEDHIAVIGMPDQLAAWRNLGLEITERRVVS